MSIVSGKKPKVLVILGPTASGKTSLSVKLAKEFNGEIISADSRQVFRGLDIGTGKDLKEYGKTPYHLIDVVNPEEEFNLAKYQKLANKAIKDILSRGKLPIITGGTGLYLQAIVDGYELNKHIPDPIRRAELEKKTVLELYQILEQEKPEFASSINNSDKNNPRRLIRYIEIMEGGETPKKVSQKKTPYNFLLLGLRQDDEEMRIRIIKRIKDRLDNEDMIGEVERLLDNGTSINWLNSLGLEYRHIAWYLQDKLDYDEMVERLGLATYRFAKRQKTWFKRWEKQGRIINWIGDLKEANKIVKNWL
jgi:tRNA dimethylallyltransferase